MQAFEMHEQDALYLAQEPVTEAKETKADMHVQKHKAMCAQSKAYLINEENGMKGPWSWSYMYRSLWLRAEAYGQHQHECIVGLVVDHRHV